ncbi:hypothetical protein JTF08_06385 [Micrococcaceae bacterium RIT802]|nr:hypothetical protein [Micrococcaceae bacterium RIT 802]
MQASACPHRASSQRSPGGRVLGADAPPDEVDGLLALAGDCSLTSELAHERMRHIAGALSGWKDAARRNRISEHEINMMGESIEPRLEAVVKAS